MSYYNLLIVAVFSKPGAEDPPDLVFVKAAKDGDRKAFEVLVKHQQHRIYTLIWKQIRNNSVAEDLTQDTFVRAYRSIKNLKRVEQFSGWLTRIALNVCNSWFSSSSYREYQYSELDEPKFQLQFHTETPESTEEFRRILGQIGALDTIYREVVVLCILESYSYTEASDALGIPTGTVASRMHIALKTLRRQLGEP